MPKRRQNKTSSELCSELGVTDVELDYTTADFKNLTSAGLFSRMMRPNLQATNPGVSSAVLSKILEVKWKEFQELNPFKEGKNNEEKEAADDDDSQLISDDSSADGSPKKQTKSIAPLKIKLFGGAQESPDSKQNNSNDRDVSEMSDEEDEAVEQQTKYGSKRARNHSDESEEENHAKKKSRRKGYKKRDKSSEFEGSEADESDYSAKKSKQPSRPVIPGERRSDRVRKTVKETVLDMSDREFNKMMRISTKSEESEKKSKGRKKKSGKKNADDEDDSKLSSEGDDTEHEFYCEVCEDGGNLILCDTCPKSFHQECIKLTIIPDGKWSCPICNGEEIPKKPKDQEEEDDEGHDHICKVCREGGDLLLCDFCPLVYHLSCLNPPLKVVPEGDWKCPRCAILEKELKGKIQKVLFWRWSHQLKGTDELDHTHSPRKKSVVDLSEDSNDSKGVESKKRPERELFVKYEFHSYWDCDWISELALEVFNPMLYMSFKKKWDLDEPPALEDGSSFGRPRHLNKSLVEDDPYQLEERFYRYGVKPEWLQIHRILVHDGKGSDLRYLVKWRDLPYTDATWEYSDEIPKGLEDFQKHVDAYNNRRKEVLDKKKEKKDKPKKSVLKVKLTQQPSYMEAGGRTLHAYQLEGLNWLRFSWAQETNTILADEMGLGKTIQAVVFMYTLWKESHTPGPFLVTAPLSTVGNWEREFEYWASDMYVVTYVGGQDNRAVIRERDFSYREGAFNNFNKPCRLREGHKPKFDVLLTSYEFPSIDYATLQSIQWSMIVVDEAHRLKASQSLFFRTLQKYKVDYKLLMTGTPLQNNLEELFNLLNFLVPEKFNNLEKFLEEFSDLSKDDQITKMHEMLASHMLRRMKIDVLKDIPPKSELIVRVEMSAMQKKFYKHILTKNFEALNRKGHSHQTSLMNVMMDLRKCCNHPYLFPSADMEAPVTPQGHYEGSALIKASGKLELLGKMLQKLKRDGHRVLIFSQMTRVLDIIEDFLLYLQLDFERIDGNVAGPARQAAIDRFNCPGSPQFVFLLSTHAGGLGINLATADTVVLFDMDWNPHNDIQAFSRAHRIGQKNKVMIYRFVCRNSVEEKMAQVCKRKMLLNEMIIERGLIAKTGPEKQESLTKQEMNAILKYGAEDLFKDEDEGKAVHYDDEAVEKLLDRAQHAEVEQGKDATGFNEFLRSFKVASYQVKEGSTAELEEEEEVVEPPVEEKDDDPHYWERVLKVAYDAHVDTVHKEQEEYAKTLGKGKRLRKQINYYEQQIERGLEDGKEEDIIEDVKYLSDYYPTSSDSSVSNMESEDDQNSEKSRLRQRRRQRAAQKQSEKAIPMPPLLSRVNGQLLVLDFTPRQRRAFLDSVMKFGNPPDDIAHSQWLCRELRGKPEKVLKAYTAMFIRHLCEPIPEGAEIYSDEVPVEGLSRHHVLTRIGLISLIRKKVAEFEENNGIDSMAEFEKVPKPLAERRREASGKPPEENKMEDKGDKKTTEEKSSEEKTSEEKSSEEKMCEDKSSEKKTPDASPKEEPPTIDKPAASAENVKSEETASTVKLESTEVDKAEPMDTTDGGPPPPLTNKSDSATNADSKVDIAKTVEKSADIPKPKKSLEDLAIELRDRFWIADGGFTPLHSLWTLEEKHIIESKEYETWHRRHDFWLLAGTVMHGYRHWPEILSDLRLDILNRPFKNNEEKAKRAAFLNRRFQLLTHALVLEEQLQRAIEDYELEKMYIKKTLNQQTVSNDKTLIPTAGNDKQEQKDANAVVATSDDKQDKKDGELPQEPSPMETTDDAVAAKLPDVEITSDKLQNVVPDVSVSNEKPSDVASSAEKQNKENDSVAKKFNSMSRDERLRMVDELAADISTNSQGHKMVAFDIPNEILQKVSNEISNLVQDVRKASVTSTTNQSAAARPPAAGGTPGTAPKVRSRKSKSPGSAAGQTVSKYLGMEHLAASAGTANQSNTAVPPATPQQGIAMPPVTPQQAMAVPPITQQQAPVSVSNQNTAPQPTADGEKKLTTSVSEDVICVD